MLNMFIYTMLKASDLNLPILFFIYSIIFYLHNDLRMDFYSSIVLVKVYLKLFFSNADYCISLEAFTDQLLLDATKKQTQNQPTKFQSNMYFCSAKH